SSPDDVLLGLRGAEPNAPSTTGGVPWTTLPSVAETSAIDDPDDVDDEAALPELRPSAVADELDRPFDQLDDDELARVGDLLEDALREWPERRSRRRHLTRAHGGPIALRRSLRDALDTGGEVINLVHTRPRWRPRNVVIVLDVSGSMEAYARAYLHLTRPLAVEHRAEVFAVATELSRITPAVRLRSTRAAIDSVTDAVGDRFSGTRLASSLHQLLHHRTWNTFVRGAVVVVFSDGWDADEPARLERVMRRLGRLAYRVVWVNPRAGADDFQPTTAGMAAALPYCDRFLAGHNARSMRAVVEAISAA
ncbi:MAG: vWA domain-containing protein, partial [Ilumatobacteraceae bacterium]